MVAPLKSFQFDADLSDWAKVGSATWVPRRVMFTAEGGNGEPDVFMRIEVIDNAPGQEGGSPRVTEFRLVAKPNGHGIRNADLRAFRSLEDFVINAFLHYAPTRLERPDVHPGQSRLNATFHVVKTADEMEDLAKDRGDESLSEQDLAAIRRNLARVKRDVESSLPSRRGRPRVPDDELVEVARVYREAINTNPTAAVAARFQIAQRTAAARVRMARDAGLLPETTRGRKRA